MTSQKQNFNWNLGSWHYFNWWLVSLNDYGNGSRSFDFGLREIVI